MAKRYPVIHFEMPADDKKRVAKFYSETFGWEMNQLGEDMSKYLLATTTQTDDKGMPSSPGINGGFYGRSDQPGYGGTHFVISVDNLEDHIEIVKKAGGKIIGEIMDIPGIGKYVSIEDTEGNVVGMLQPSEGV